MKIGVYLPDISPQSGGAFTFVETVLSGLATLKSDYEYHVFFYGTNKHLKSLSGENLFFHSLGKSGLLRFLQKIYYFYFAPIFQYLVFNINAKLKIKLHYPYSSKLDKACQKQGAHLMWFPTPQYEKVEGPYILTIWDLEHRAQPYFPEVSANGEWDGREKHFKSAIQRASYVVTGTNVGREEISQFYGVMKDRIKILPHPTPEFALKTYSQFNLPLIGGQ
ncbi:MAG: hypothetical protein IPM57_00700 [Oligoflexia bacterium]|nr:hypothetical protein [Oligoflexia bacterium]